MSIQTPDWLKHAVVYQIFPDRFAKGNPPDNTVPQSQALEPWSASPTLNAYKGGNLWGIIDRLDYLIGLGVTALYLNPIFQSTSNHRYNTSSYYDVDVLLGGNVAFTALLQACQAKGLRLLLDGVFNHCGRGFFGFTDVLENGPYSPWVDWFRIEGWPIAAFQGDRPANYQGWAGYRELPAFNHDNPVVREYLMQVGEHWVRQGIDGWRLDVPYEVKASGFWQEFRDRIKAINPEAYIVGEVWEDARPWLDGTQFDGVMNYLFTGPTIAFTAGDRVICDHVVSSYQVAPALSAADYGAKMQDLLTLYPWEIQLAQLNSLDSHDTARLLTIAGGDRASVELATVLLFTFPGAPCIYYGDEVGLAGGIDPDSRRSFPPESEWDSAVLTTHRQLIALRKIQPELRTGDYVLLYAQGLVYVFARVLAGRETIVAINVGTTQAQVQILSQGHSLPTHTVYRLKSQPSERLYGVGQYQWLEQDELILNLPPRSSLILGPP